MSCWQVRARYGLDAMVLISNDASYCGLAYVMNDPRSFNYPFSVISPNCLPLTLAHELGHNFGMQHDHDQYTAGGFGPHRAPAGDTCILSIHWSACP